MNILFKVSTVGILSALAGWIAHELPEARVRELGGLLSPRSEVSVAFLPKVRLMLAVVAALGMGAGAGSLLFRRGLIAAFRKLIIALRAESCEVGRTLACALHSLSGIHRAALLFVFLLGVALRLWFINQPMQFDESTTMNMYACSPWYIALANYSMPNNHLLNTLFVRASVLLAGDAPSVIRATAFLAGVLLLVAVYVYTSHFYSRPAAALAFSCVCVGMPFVDMSVNARGYSLVALAGVLAHLAAYHIVTRRSVLAGLIYAMCIGSGLVAIPVALLFVLSSAACALIFYYRTYGLTWRTPVCRLLFCAALVGALLAALGYAPMLVALGPRWLFANDWVQPLSGAEFLRQLPDELGNFARYNLQAGAFHALFVIVGLLLYLVQFPRVERCRVSVPAVVATVCVAMLMISRRYPYWGLSPMWMFLSAIALAGGSGAIVRVLSARLSSARVESVALMAAAVIGLTGAASVIEANPLSTMNARGRYANPDSERIIEHLAKRLTEQDRVLTDHAAAIYQFYSDRRDVPAAVWDWDIRQARVIYILSAHAPEPRYRQLIDQALAGRGLLLERDFRLERRFAEVDLYSNTRPPSAP